MQLTETEIVPIEQSEYEMVYSYQELVNALEEMKERLARVEANKVSELKEQRLTRIEKEKASELEEQKYREYKAEIYFRSLRPDIPERHEKKHFNNWVEWLLWRLP